jgi:hypothetical protein
MAGWLFHGWDKQCNSRCFFENPPDFWLVVTGRFEIKNNWSFNRDNRKVCTMGLLGKQKI